MESGGENAREPLPNNRLQRTALRAAAEPNRSPNPVFIGLQNTVAAMLPRCENAYMTTRVEQIAEQVKLLPVSEREQLLSWLAEFELGQTDSWDAEIARDSQPGGRMQRVLDRVRRDIAEGRTKPLDEVIDNE